MLVYIRGNEVTYTPNLEFFPLQNSHPVDTVASDGLFALFDIFYRPARLADPVFFPNPYNHYLPTEICQNIFSRTCPATRTALETSCRLFRLISHDYGHHVGDWYLQKLSTENGRTAFLGERYEVPNPMRPRIGSRDPALDAGRRRGGYTRRMVVGILTGHPLFRSIYSTLLIMPDSNFVRLDLPLREVEG